MLAGAHEQQARFGGVALERFNDILRALDVDSMGEIRVPGGVGDEGHCRQVDHRIRSGFLNYAPNHRGIADIHGIDVESRHPMTGGLQARDKPGSHKPARAADKDSHWGAAFHREPLGANADPGAGCYLRPSTGGL